MKESSRNLIQSAILKPKASWQEELRIDFHAHLEGIHISDPIIRSRKIEEELRIRQEQHVLTCFSAGSKEEWEILSAYQDSSWVLRSFGIHPWYVDRGRAEDMENAFCEADVIGEIGMDNVWCDTDLKLQRRQLIRQLEIAARLHKPVVLHTKGQERQIAELICDFPERICVHWFSGTEKELEPYLEKQCYFTLGPDTADVKDASARASRERILKEVPLDHLFVETDGISAAAWGYGIEMLAISEVSNVLNKTISYLSEIKEVEESSICKEMSRNLLNFI